MAEAVIELEQIERASGSLHVLRGIDLEVGQGEVVCVLGPSGSGKSTLLRCINLLEPPDGGPDPASRAWRSPPGRGEPNGVDYVRRHVGMVFQQFNLFPHKSAIENVSIAQRRVLGRGEGEARTKAAALLKRVGLADKLDEYPDGSQAASSSGSRSPGRWRWIPSVMLFDEVTSALDPELIKEVLDVDAGARRGGDDDDRRHPRDGLRAGRRRPGRLHGRGGDRRGGAGKQVIDDPKEERTKRFLGLVLEH